MRAVILACIAACALPLTGCYPVTPVATSAATPAPRDDKYVGQKLWVRPSNPLYVCAGPPPNDNSMIPLAPCGPVKSGSFTVERAVYGRHGIIDGYVIKLDNGKPGFIRGSTDIIFTDDETLHKERLAEKAACDRKGGVAVGMTRAQVYASCWGKPQKINTTTTAGGDHDQLVYGNSYVYLRNGVVTSIQTSR